VTQAEETLKIAKARQLARSGAGRMLREAAGLNGHELARAIDVDPSTLWRWEEGSRRPRGEWAIRYADFLEELGGG
jgi:transcriptional regulator with XRE-family HTH domain